jgi:hypothetical protein
MKPKPLPTKKVPVKAHTRTVTVKSTPPPKATTVDPIQQQVDAAQLPQIQQIQNAQSASAQAAKDSATSAQGYYAALANLLTGIAPQVQNIYSSAAGADTAFGKGFANGLAQVQGQTSAEGQNAANLSGGTAPVVPAAGTGATDALYGLGGYLPGSTLEREGAAAATAAAQLPATATGQGAADIAQIAHQQTLDQQGFTKQLQDLAAQVPGLRLQYQSAADAQANAAAKQALDVRAQNLAETTQRQHETDVQRQNRINMILATGIGPDGKLTPRAAAQLAAATGYDPITGKPTARTTIAQQNANTALARAKTTAANAAARLTLAQQKQLSDMYGVDANGNLTLPGRKAALAEWKAQHPASKGGFTKSQLQKIQAKAGQTADEYFNGKTKTVMVNGSPQSVTTQNREPDYQTALREMVAGGVPLTVAQKALDAYWPYGDENKGKVGSDGGPMPYGRPYLNVQMRMTLQQAWPGHQVDPYRKPTSQEVALLAQNGINYTGPVNTNSAVPYPPPTK